MKQFTTLVVTAITAATFAGCSTIGPSPLTASAVPFVKRVQAGICTKAPLARTTGRVWRSDHGIFVEFDCERARQYAVDHNEAWPDTQSE